MWLVSEGGESGSGGGCRDERVRASGGRIENDSVADRRSDVCAVALPVVTVVLTLYLLWSGSNTNSYPISLYIIQLICGVIPTPNPPALYSCLHTRYLRTGRGRVAVGYPA